MTRGRRLLAASLAVLCVVGAPHAHAVTLSLEPATATVTEGDVFSVAVNISGLGDGGPLSLSFFDLTIGSDPTHLVATGTPTFGDPILGDQLDFIFGSLTGFDFGIEGAADVNELSFDDEPTLLAFQAPEFTLVTIDFLARAPTPGGPTLLGFDFVQLVDESGFPSFIDPVTLLGAEITIEARTVPEPGTLVLLALGAAALARRRTGAAR